MIAKWERAASVLVTIAALVVAGAVVRREFFQPPIAPAAGRSDTRPSEFIPNWQEMIGMGRLVGDPAAPVKLIEFVDIECPFCARFNTTLQSVTDRYPGKVALIFVHLPLPNHRFARPGAQALECASDQERFSAMLDALFDKQDSLGLKPWDSFANDAGVADIAGFSECMARTSNPPMVEAGVELARKMAIRATPTVVLNGWRYSTAPSAVELLRDVDDVLKGRNPSSANVK